MDLTYTGCSIKLSIKEFTDLISQEEWNKLYKRLAEKAEKMSGQNNLEYDDCLNESGEIEFIFSSTKP